MVNTPIASTEVETIPHPVEAMPSKYACYSSYQLYPQFCALMKHNPLATKPTRQQYQADMRNPTHDKNRSRIYSQYYRKVRRRRTIFYNRRKRMNRRYRQFTTSFSNRRLLALLFAFASGLGHKCVQFDTDSVPIVVDTGASESISMHRDDFVHYEPVKNVNVRGIASGLQVQGVGTIRWVVKNDQGETTEMFCHNALHIPKCPVRLLSPQRLADTSDDEYSGFFILKKFSIIRWDNQTMIVDYNRQNNLPMFTTAEGSSKYATYLAGGHHTEYNCDIETALDRTLGPDAGRPRAGGQKRRRRVTFIDQIDSDIDPPNKINPAAAKAGRLETRSNKNRKCDHSPPIFVAKHAQSSNASQQINDDDSGPRRQSDDRVCSTASCAPNSDSCAESQGSQPAPQNEEYCRPTTPVQTLNVSQQIFLEWHERLGHMANEKIRELARQGKLPKLLANVKPPICPSCQYGKAERRRENKAKRGSIGKAKAPGDMVSVDQMISATPGRQITLSGKPSNSSYSIVTIFVDHVTNFSFAHFQESASATETIEAKRAFERIAAQHNIKVKAYHADNGIFKSKEFSDVVKHDGQSITFCGVGAHHQNGKAERQIKTFTTIARTMMLHAQNRWPDVITWDLWPFAVKLAVDIYNARPHDKQKLSPEELFAGTPRDRNDYLTSFHTFGCPVFVLDESLQDGKIHPKWDPRSRQAVYLGKSSHHASNVAWVLNLKTGHISPQYHLVFDDSFTTVGTQKTNTLPDNWDVLYRYHRSYVNFDTENTWKLGPDWDLDERSTPYKGTAVYRKAREHGKKIIEKVLSNPEEEETEQVTLTNEEVRDQVSQILQDSPSTVRRKITKEAIKRGPYTKTVTKDMRTRGRLYDPIKRRPINLGVRRSYRRKQVPSRLVEDTAALMAEFKTGVIARADPRLDSLVAHFLNVTTIYDNSQNEFEPLCFAAGKSKTNPDTLTLREMYKQQDCEKFREQMQLEISDMYKNKVFSLHPREQVPRGQNIIKAIWSFRRKRTPDGEVYRHRARLCCHGGMQKEGIDYNETYAPVISWSTVRLLLLLSQLHGMHTRQVDYVQAFPQADLDDDVYMDLPAEHDQVPGGDNRKYCLKLHKNLYGLKQAAKNFFLLLQTTLEGIGFKQSQVDPCLFLRDDCICAVYVDDTLFFSKDKKVLDEVVNSLNAKLALKDEGEVNDFLGIKIRKQPDGGIELTQPMLIQNVLKLLGLTGDEVKKIHNTPGRHWEKGRNTPEKFQGCQKPREQSWNYRSAIGQLSYLQNNTRPDIATATHLCARHCSNPYKSHEEAVKHIGRYLLGTADKGMIMKPDKSLTTLDCYVDADFAGLWNSEDAESPASVVSRSGYVIRYFGCPILWASKLQTEIALSTTESEYIALSTACRELIHLKELLNEVQEAVGIPKVEVNCHAKIFEDNTACEELAKVPKNRPRTKHIAVKYHHFREHVRKGTFQVQRVSTKDQYADIFTKLLPEPLFKALRKGIMGW